MNGINRSRINASPKFYAKFYVYRPLTPFLPGFLDFKSVDFYEVSPLPDAVMVMTYYDRYIIIPCNLPPAEHYSALIRQPHKLEHNWAQLMHGSLQSAWRSICGIGLKIVLIIALLLTKSEGTKGQRVVRMFPPACYRLQSRSCSI